MEWGAEGGCDLLLGIDRLRGQRRFEDMFVGIVIDFTPGSSAS